MYHREAKENIQSQQGCTEHREKLRLYSESHEMHRGPETNKGIMGILFSSKRLLACCVEDALKGVRPMEK